METVSVFILLMMTVGLSHGIETPCDARQNLTQCYGAVNGTVSLRLVEKIETGYDCQWAKTKSTIHGQKVYEVFEFRKKRFTKNVEYQNRSSFDDSSGTFKMRDVTRSDKGQYVLYIFEISGVALQPKYLNLSVQAAVSSLKLSSECLSQGQRSVSCSCEGDSVQYSWTLNGEPLTDKQLFSGHLDTNNITLTQGLSRHHDTQNNENITLTQGLSGSLACYVKNSVSNDTAFEDVKPCPGFKFVNCTLSNGTRIPPQWVSENDTLCATTPTPTPVTPVTTITTPMTASERPSGKETDNITSTSSYTSSNQSTSLCRENREDPWVFRYIPHIAGSLAALLLVLVAGLGIYCSQKKKKKKSTGADAEDQDVTYADVRLVQNADTRVRRAERQVEYGEVKGSKVRGSGGQHNADSTEADCIYAKVRV